MTDQELQQNYPAYSKSIFADFKPDDTEVLGWQSNVLNKVKGNNILPHYVKKDRDFDIFWGWITHFFAIIVYFARNFKKFFTDYQNYLNEIREFMRERDYIQDSRVQINKDLTIPLAEEIYHKIFCDYSLKNNIMIPTNKYCCSDYLPIAKGAVITLKVLGYNRSLEEYSEVAINDIKVSWYSADKTIIGGLNSFNITALQAKLGYRLPLPSNNIYYIKVSYPRLGDSNLPLYLGVFLEGKGILFQTDRTENDIFRVHSDFRKRGTFKGNSLIKKVLESKKEDNFYADYLSQKNTGWFLNKNSPTFGGLFKNVKIDSIVANEISNAPGYTIVTMKEQYFMLNQNTSLIVKWKGNLADSVAFNISIYDKDKNLLSDVPILGNWVFDSINHTLTPSSLGGTVVINPKSNSEEGLNVAELAIELIDNPKSAIFNTDTFDKERFLDNLYLFSKYNNSKTNEAYYLRVTSVVLIGPSGPSVPYVENDLYNTNFETGLYLRKLPINLGFLNNKQYYICCFKNNGSYSDEKVKEVISQKIIPYNGHRVFIDNSYYKNNINIDLDFKKIYFNKISKKIHVEITGGVPPYKYYFLSETLMDRSLPINSYLQTYEESVDYGNYIVKILDSLGKSLLVKLSCQPYNKIDYRFKLYVGKDNSIEVFIKIFGGTETSYDINKYIYTYPVLYDENNNLLLDRNNFELSSREISEEGKMTISSNIWANITNIIGNNFSYITPNLTLYIKDNGIINELNWFRDEYNDLELPLQNLFKDFAVDIYDNGNGELVN